MKISRIALVLCLTLGCASAYAGDCSKKQAKKAVETACKQISSMGKESLKKIRKFRYCGTNYVWVQDSNVKMVLHPIKPRLNGRNLKESKDKKGKKLFVEFDKMAKKNKKKGGWVDYYWAKPGAEKATAKISFVKMCPGALKWIAGSGIWK